jgi:hypothetical protein
MEIHSLKLGIIPQQRYTNVSQNTEKEYNTRPKVWDFSTYESVEVYI